MIQDELDLYPFADGKKHQFKCPAPTTYEKYLDHIMRGLKEETPVAYGLHPNAEIDFRTRLCKDIFIALQELMPNQKVEKKSDEDMFNESPKTDNEIVK